MQAPKCPKCSKTMVLRDGKYGHFWGCSGYPKCKGIRKYYAQKQTIGFIGQVEPYKIENPSGYQSSIFDFALNGTGNGVVSAGAGSGKTATIRHLCGILTGEIINAVFNTHVEKAAIEKGIPALTTHKMGFAAIRNFVTGSVQVKNDKVNKIVKNLISEKWDEEKWMISPVCNLVGKLKNTLAPSDNDTLSKIADKFGIEVNGSQDRIFELVRLALNESNKNLAEIDFDDMIYLPWKFKMPVKQYDWVLGDEVQDWNRAQIELILRSVKDSGRVIAVGDRKQSMYGFRGADITAMDRITEALRAVEMPLSITYRCPSSHVDMVNELFPEIPFEKWEGAKEGQILSMSLDKMLGEVVDSDLVLCRTNAPLVKPVFALIRQGVKAIIRGRDIGQNLITLIEKFEDKADGLNDFLYILDEYARREIAKLIATEKNSQAESLSDKVETIIAISDGCQFINEVKVKIEEVFSDKKEGVIFSTVHRAKGDEANRVFILEPQLMPHKMATKDWEIQQEKNILYVALTRAKETLVFVGGPAPLPIWDEEETEEILVKEVEEMLEKLDIPEATVYQNVEVSTDDGVKAEKQFNIKDGNWVEPIIPDCPF